MDIVITNKGTVSDRQGNVYNTVKIGNQWWMSENLKSTVYNSTGVALNTYSGGADWMALGQWNGAYVVYDNNNANDAIYGKLYNWQAVSSNNLCPTGWHVPTFGEWNILKAYLMANGYADPEGSEAIGKSLASTTGWAASIMQYTVGYDQPSNNKSGFTGLPGGYRGEPGGNFNGLVSNAYWWSSSEYSPSITGSAYLFYLSATSGGLTQNFKLKTYGCSIRCMK
jgi:uncharacterized protein (TIGR02145 family)